VVNNSLDAIFGALADPTRRGILARLSLGEATVTELAEPFDMSLPAVLKHVGALEGAGLVVAHKDGRVRRCRLETKPLEAAAEWIARYGRFWEERFDAIADYLAQTRPANEADEEETWRLKDQALRRRGPIGSGSRAPSKRRGTGSSGLSRTRKR
jgi:DNA-binding transcriptional ArsR family regulator